MQPWQDQALMQLMGKGGMTKGKAKGNGKGSKAKGNGKGSKAKGNGKGKMQAPPQEACYRCGDTGHFPVWCPCKTDTCDNCGKVGHTAWACTATAAPPPKATTSTCHCCGKDGHKKAECHHLKHECTTCRKSGHIESICRYKNQNKDKGKDEGIVHQAGCQPTWCCITCGDDGKPLYLEDKQKKCPKCNKPRLDGDEAKKATTVPKPVEPKPDELCVQNWLQQPPDGTGVASISKEIQARLDRIARMEQMIILLQVSPDDEEELKAKQALIKQLKSKVPANSVAKDHQTLARTAKEAEEKLDKKVTAAKALLQKKVDAMKQWRN